MPHLLIDTFAALPAIDFPAPQAPPGSEKVMQVISWISWGAVIAGFVGFVIVGVRLMLSNSRGEGTSEHGKRLAMVFGGLIIAGAAAGLVTLFLG